MSVLGWLIVTMYVSASVVHIIMWMRGRAYRDYIMAHKQQAQNQN